MYLNIYDNERAVVNLDSSEFKYIDKIVGILRKLPYAEYIAKLRRYVLSIKRLTDFEKKIEDLCLDDLFIILDSKVTKSFFEYVIFLNIQKRLKSESLLDVTLGEYNKYSKLPLMSYQTIGAHFVYRAKRALLADVVGLGKPQWILEPILTPNGWKRLNDLTLSDIIYGDDGEKYNIDKIYFQGFIDMYRIYFRDGTSCTSGLDHLWKVQHTANGKRDGWKIRSLREMITIGIHNNHVKGDGSIPNKWRISMIKPIKFRKKKLLIDPYVLGVLIGDGSLSNDRAVWSTPDIDYDIVERMKKILDKDYIIVENSKASCPNYSITRKDKTKHLNSMIQKIKKLGLNVKSLDKFIPKKYKYSSIEQRIDLLRGLMDTDGGSRKDNKISFYTSSKRLANDVAELIRSLGGISNIRAYDYCNQNTEYQVNVKINICPFYLKRKAINWRETTKNINSRTIEDVVYIGKKKAKCISVNSKNGMYVCGNFIPSHNTPQSIIAAEKMLKKDDYFNVLVVVPSSLKKKWYNDIGKFLGPNRAIMIDGTKQARSDQYRFIKMKNKFIIMNYDLAIRDWDEFLFGEIDDGKERIVIFDEVQYLKNDTAKRTKKCIELSEHCKSIIGLSATFLETSIMDVFNIMKVIDRNMLGGKYWNFFNKYVITDFWGKEIGHNDITDIVEALEPVKIRRQKEQVLKQLPDRSEITYWCKLTKDQESCYNDVLNNIATKMKSDRRINQVASAEILAQIQLLIQVCLSTELLDYNVTSSSKLTLLYDIIEQVGNQKIVIFVKYVKMVEIIARELIKRGYKTFFVHGKSIKNVTEKQNIVDSFNETNNHQILVTSDVLKEGIDLVGASVLINFDLLWNPASMEQRAGRLDRIGQKNNVTVMYLITEGTIEQRMFDLLQTRKDLSTMIVDGGYKSSRITIKQLLFMAGVEK